jgi:hypothetical protein
LSICSFPIDQFLPATVKGYQQYVVLIRGPALGGVVVALHFDTPSDFKNSRAAGRACSGFAGRIIYGTDSPDADGCLALSSQWVHASSAICGW